MTQQEIENEKILLGLLFNYQDVCFDILQIKPFYLQKQLHQHILDSFIKSYENDKTITLGKLSNYNKDVTIDTICDIIDDEYLPVTQIRQHFMNYQCLILDSYKKVVINDLTKKLNAGTIMMDDYLKKMAKIKEIKIKTETLPLTKEEIEENISSKEKSIHLKSFKHLDDLLHLVQGDFLMIGASTGVGKSGLLLNFMNDLMENYQCIYFNMEMSKTTIYKRILSIKSGVPLDQIEPSGREYYDKEYITENVNKAIAEIVKNHIVIEHKATDIEEIKKVLQSTKNDEKHTIVFLDHIGLIRCSTGKSQYEQMTEIAKQLRQLCLDFDCTIISACQLNRASYNAEELSLSMLKDSGELENSSSKVILLYRDKRDKELNPETKSPKMNLEIVKNRDGILGNVTCIYHKEKQVFEEVN